MKAKELFYKISVSDIPFKKIDSLGKTNYKFIYCKSISISQFSNIDLFLTTVLDVFDDINDVAILAQKEILFGPVLCEKLSVRSRTCLKIGEKVKEVNKNELPHLKYNSSTTNSQNGNWFYSKEGEYSILGSIKSEFEKVKHLETLSVYNESIIKLRFVFEIIKRNLNSGLIKEIDFPLLATKIIKSDPVFKNIDDDSIKDAATRWAKEMMIIPSYKDISKNNLGRVIK